jgi:hypothetical protein
MLRYVAELSMPGISRQLVDSIFKVPKRVRLLDFSTNEDKTSKLSRKVGHHSHSDAKLQGGSNMTGTNCDLFTHK